jgi:phthalate 4,5-dioxygenase oxygenase subunit
MIARTRRRLLLAARALRDQDTMPPGVQDPGVFFGARASSFLHDPAVPLEEAYQAQLAQATRWPAKDAA